MGVSIDLSLGITKIWEADEGFQTDCLRGILTQIRHHSNEGISEMHFNYLKSQGAFFVHNDDYMVEYFGESIKDANFGIYTSFGRCTLAGRLAIPIRLFDDTVLGFIGYSNKPEDLDASAVFIKYLYPPKAIFNKGRYFYITPQEYKKAVEDGYICIVDGIFDKIILQCLGINAVSLCGSSLTQWHKYYLSFIKHKVVVADNDLAGRKLASYCKYSLPDCVEILQADAGDIDSLLRSDSALKNFMNCFEQMKQEDFILSHRLPSPGKYKKVNNINNTGGAK